MRVGDLRRDLPDWEWKVDAGAGRGACVGRRGAWVVQVRGTPIGHVTARAGWAWVTRPTAAEAVEAAQADVQHARATRTEFEQSTGARPDGWLRWEIDGVCVAHRPQGWVATVGARTVYAATWRELLGAVADCVEEVARAELERAERLRGVAS